MNKESKLPYTLFFVLMALVSWYFYHPYILEFPRAVHAWTQSDRYALSLGFIDNGFDFFHPTTYNLKGKEGVTQVDFPIVEYLVAVFMQLFGTREPVVFRIVVLLISITGLYFLYKICLRSLRSTLLALVMVGFAFTLPVYVYNQAGFIPSVPAFSFSLIAFFYVYRVYRYKEEKYRIHAIFFLTLAALIRLPFAMLLIAFVINELLIAFSSRKVKGLFAPSLGLMIIGAYYVYNQFLAKTYGSIFWMTPLSIKNFQELKDVLLAIWDRWLLDYLNVFHYTIYIVAFFTSILILRSIKRKRPFKWSLSLTGRWLLILTLGSVMYFFLNGLQFIDHDYYFIDAFQFLFVIGLFFPLKTIARFRPRFRVTASFFLLAILIPATIQSKKVLDKRFQIDPFDQVEQARQAFEEGNALLEKLGVPKDAELLVIQAYTFNTPFIYLNRKGYTALVCRNGNMNHSLLEQADYVVIPTRFIVDEVLPFAPYLLLNLEPLGRNNHLSVYTVKKRKNPQQLFEFLQIMDATITKNLTENLLEIAVADTINGQEKLHVDPKMEFNMVLKINGMINTPSYLHFTGEIKGSEELFVKVVLSVERNGETIHYAAQSLLLEQSIEAWEKFNADVFQPLVLRKGDIVKFYLYNPRANEAWISNPKLINYSFDD